MNKFLITLGIILHVMNLCISSDVLPTATCWQQSQVIKMSQSVIKAVATDNNNKIYAAIELPGGNSNIIVFSQTGEKLETISVNGAIKAIGVIDDGSIFIGGGNRIWKITNSRESRRITEWKKIPDKAIITSIAADSLSVFVADAGNKIVHVFNHNGELLRSLNSNDGFVIPSPLFDVAVDGNGGFWVSNPGRHQIENYTASGRFVALWQPVRRNGFLGCCNPAHFQTLPGGRFVTSEKGIIRVRVFMPDGKLDSVVCGPDTFMPGSQFGHGLAVDKNQRIIVIDPKEQMLRIFIMTGRIEKGGK